VFVHVPIAMATGSKKSVAPDSDLWTSVLAATGQPARWD
jgi:6-phosphofructokinase 1